MTQIQILIDTSNMNKDNILYEESIKINIKKFILYTKINIKKIFQIN